MDQLQSQASRITAGEHTVVDVADILHGVIGHLRAMSAHPPPSVEREPVVWADDATPFTGPEVLDMLKENESLRKERDAARAEVERLKAELSKERELHRECATWADYETARKDLRAANARAEKAERLHSEAIDTLSTLYYGGR